MKKMFKKSIACLIAVMMVITMFPISALAATLTKSANSLTNTSYANMLLYTGNDDFIGIEYTNFTPLNNDAEGAIGQIIINKGDTVSFRHRCDTMFGSRSSAGNVVGWHYGSKANWGETYYEIYSDAAFSVSCTDSSVSTTVSGFGKDGINKNDTYGPNWEQDISTNFVTSAFNNSGKYYLTVNYKYQMKSKRISWSTKNEISTSDKLLVIVNDEYTFKNAAGTTVKTVTAAGDAEALKEAPANTATTTVSLNNGQHTRKTYSWPTTSTNSVFTEIETSTTTNCTMQDVADTAKEATCTENGKYADQKCSVCGYVATGTTIDMSGHSWGAWTADEDAETHTRTCAKGDGTQTENCTNVDGSCPDCGREYIDFTAYDAAVAAVKTNATGEYTEASFTAYTNAVNAAKIDKDTATQEEVDEATKAIEEATALLRNAKITITFIVYDEDGDVVDESSEEYDYGERVTLDANGTVTKWTITDNAGNDTNLVRADSTIDLLATKNQTVNAVLKADEQKDPQAEYAKVNFYGKNGVLFDVKYIEKQVVYTTDIVLANTGVSAPSVAFYDFHSWTLNAIRRGATDEIDMYANYRAKAETKKCNVVFNGQTKVYAYDSYVYLPSFAAWDGSDLALSTTEDESGLLTYINGDSFYAPHADTIYVIKVAGKQDSTAITGSYALTDAKGVVFNAKFYANDMSKVQEYGIVVINPVTGAEKVVKADSASENNEYSVKVTLPSTTTLTSLKAKSYVVIDGVTIYSDVATQTL